MKILIILLFVCSFMGCNNAGENDNKGSNTGVELKIMTIDGCEYVVCENSNWTNVAAAMVHHGNCHNPEHK